MYANLRTTNPLVRSAYRICRIPVTFVSLLRTSVLFVRGQAERVKRTTNPPHGLLTDVSIALGRSDIAMPQKLLNVANVYPIFEQVGSKRVAQGIKRCWFADPRLDQSVSQPLQCHHTTQRVGRQYAPRDPRCDALEVRRT